MAEPHREAADEMATEEVAHECLSIIATSQTDDSMLSVLRLLRSTADEPSGTELVERLEVERPTVYNRINNLREWGFLWQTDSGFRTTRAGFMAIETYEAATTDLPDPAIAHLAGGGSRRAVVNALASGPATKATLADRDHLPARSTIHRRLGRLRDRGWVTELDNGKYKLTSTGRTALDSYRELAAAFEQLIAKSELLARLEYWAAPPVRALSGTELVQNTSDDPHALLNASVDAADIRSNGFNHLRSIAPLFDPTMYDVFEQYVGRGTTFEVIFDQPTYRQLAQPRQLHYLASAVMAPNVEVRIHPDPLYSGLGIYNHNTVMLGGSTRFEQDFGVVGQTNELLAWANGTFDRLWAESESPSDRFGTWLKQTVDPRR